MTEPTPEPSTDPAEPDPTDRPPMPWAATLGAWTIGALVFFRQPIMSGFDHLTGDRGDLRLVVFLHEHWWRVVQGDAPWRSPPMFHPSPGALGYSDTFALSQVVYLPLRAVGVDQFAAVQVTLICFTLVGFASVVALTRCHLALATPIACLLAIPVAFANNLYVDSPHTQLYAAQVIPLVVLLAVAGWRATTPRRRLLLAGGSGLLLGLLLWSSFYFGWFALVLGGVWLLAAATLVAATGRISTAVAEVRSRWRTITAWASGLLVGLIPFAATYGPVLDETQARSYDEVAGLAPRPGDLINVGRHNVIWGRAVESLLGGDARLDQLHRSVAVTPVLVVLVAVATFDVVRRWRRRPPLDALGIVALATSATVAVAVVLPIQFGFGGLWAWAHRFVPGGDAIRVYGRVEVVAGFLAVMAVAVWMAGTHRWSAPLRLGARYERGIQIAVVAALSLVAIEQINTTSAFRDLDRSEERAFLDSISEPPPACTSFFVVDPATTNDDWTQIDTMLIAHRFDLPTLNGYTGQRPPDWGLRGIADPAYSDRVDAWIDRWNLDQVCVFDAATRTWSNLEAERD